MQELFSMKSTTSSASSLPITTGRGRNCRGRRSEAKPSQFSCMEYVCHLLCTRKFPMIEKYSSPSFLKVCADAQTPALPPTIADIVRKGLGGAIGRTLRPEDDQATLRSLGRSMFENQIPLDIAEIEIE